MNQSEKIEYLLKCVDALRIQVELLNAKQATMNYMILDVTKKEIPDKWPEIYSRYVDTLEQASNGCLKNLESMIYDPSNPIFIQQQFSIFQNIQSLKRDPSYHPQRSAGKK